MVEFLHELLRQIRGPVIALLANGPPEAQAELLVLGEGICRLAGAQQLLRALLRWMFQRDGVPRAVILDSHTRQSTPESGARAGLRTTGRDAGWRSLARVRQADASHSVRQNCLTGSNLEILSLAVFHGTGNAGFVNATGFWYVAGR